MLKLSELVAEGAIVAGLESPDREGVVRELVGALVRAGALPEALRDELTQRVLDREKRDSTGFGCGVAVPHSKHPALTRMVAAVGLSARGLDFASRDRQPVYSVFLLLSPQDNPEDHLKAMEVIFKNLSKPTFRRFLRHAHSAADVKALLLEADEQQHLAV